MFGLADRLRKAREYAELDQAVIARDLGASRATISNAERGTHAPRRSLVIASPAVKPIGVTEAADRLAMTRRQVQRLVDKGDLVPVAKMRGRTGAYLFDPAEVERFAEEKTS